MLNVGRQMTEDRRQRTEGRGQKSEDRCQRTEGGGQMTEDRGVEVGMRTRRRPKRMGLCSGKHAEFGKLGHRAKRMAYCRRAEDKE